MLAASSTGSLCHSSSKLSSNRSSRAAMSSTRWALSRTGRCRLASQ
jgi:hypothetical protein